MNDLHPYVNAKLKAVISAQSESQIMASDELLVGANEILNVPVTIKTAWPYPSDYEEYTHYAYVHVQLAPDVERIVRIGGNAGQQILSLQTRGRLPSRRTLTRIDRVYFWKRARY
jgi:hypothetical protein